MKNPLLLKPVLFAACAFSGWISAFAMPQVSLWPCLFLGLSLFYWLYSKAEGAGTTFLCGFFFALGYFVTGLWWIGNALLVEGNDFAWVWPISVIGLPTLLGLFTGTYVAIAKMIAPSNTLKGFFVFVFFLTFSEWARSHAFSGFPWNLYGYVWSDHLVMAQIAHYTGAYGLTILSVFWAAMGGFLLTQKRSPRYYASAVTLVAASMSAVYLFGDHRLKSNPTEFDPANAVIVVQPNIPQDMKWDPQEVQRNFEKTIRLSRGATFDDTTPDNVFVVWPETTISPSIYSVQDNMDAIRAMLEYYEAGGINAYLVAGTLRRTQAGDGQIGSANSVLFLNSRLSAIDIYDKYHLVPFGEFIPLQDLIPLRPVAAFRGFERGDGPATITKPGLPSFSPLICYEVIFPDEVVNRRTERPRWIVNVTNDGWYGDSAGPHQHFAQTRLRAIEEGLPVIRSANTGISGIFDAYGRSVAEAGIFQDAFLVSALPLPLPRTAPYWPWVLQLFLPAIALTLIFTGFSFKKPKRI